MTATRSNRRLRPTGWRHLVRGPGASQAACGADVSFFPRMRIVSSRRYAVRVIPDHPHLCPSRRASSSSVGKETASRRDRVRETAEGSDGPSGPSVLRLVDALSRLF